MTRAMSAGALLAAALGGCGEPASNLLLISIDTLRSDHTSAYGYERATTPRLEEVARDGVRFELAYSPSSSTAPSHATLFTGTYPITHGVIKNGLALGEEVETLAERLAARGYQTMGVASSFVLDPRFGLSQGFERWDHDFRDSSWGADSEWEGHRVEIFDRRAEEATDVALHWLREERDPERPFFLFVHYFDPHAPYAPPGEHGLRFAEHAGASGELSHKIQLYDAEIAYTDFQLGRLLDALDALALRERTLLVIAADHGEAFGEHGYVYHGLYVYEEEVRVPLLVRWPGVVESGRVLKGPVEFVDIVPTVLDLLGVSASADDLPGRSLAGALCDAEPLDDERPVFLLRRHFEAGRVSGFRVNGMKYAVREGRWKYIVDGGLDIRELYDLEADPAESANRYYDEPQVAKRLAERVASWRSRYERPQDVPRIEESERRALEALGYVE